MALQNEEPFLIEMVPSITLDEVFSGFNLEKVKMLKTDCEGAEYEFIPKAKNLPKIEYLVGEFHRLFGERDPEPLLEYCKKFFPEGKMIVGTKN